MKMIESETSLAVEIDPNAEAFCEKEGVKMFKHLSALFPKDGTIKTASKYKLWNIGKLAVWYWLRRLERERLLRLVRTPFKDEYTVHEDIDDMIVFLMRNGETYHLEVRTRESNILPPKDKTLRLDGIKPMVIYIFVVYHPTTYTANIVGWGNWDVLKTVATEVASCEQDGELVRAPGEFVININDMKSVQDGVKWMKGI